MRLLNQHRGACRIKPSVQKITPLRKGGAKPLSSTSLRRPPLNVKGAGGGQRRLRPFLTFTRTLLRPAEVIEQVGFFQGVRLYGTARNVFTITKYEGADPEFTQPISIGGYPPSRQFTFGVELKF